MLATASLRRRQLDTLALMVLAYAAVVGVILVIRPELSLPARTVARRKA